jgi:hypothetical protein
MCISMICLVLIEQQTEVAYVIPMLLLSIALRTPLLPKIIENQDFKCHLKTLTTRTYCRSGIQ